MAFIFVPLETISYTFRAVSLGVRLWVNMLAGHTLLHILTGKSQIMCMPDQLQPIHSMCLTMSVRVLVALSTTRMYDEQVLTKAFPS